MFKMINRLLDKASNYLSHRKGLLPILGIGMVIINLIFQFIPGEGWLTESNIFLHLGIILAIIGFLLAWAL